MRPNESFLSSFRDAVSQGVRAARENFFAMLFLEGAMAALVAIYYMWPAGAHVLSAYATWQNGGGVLAAAGATAIAGGLLSEASAVYFQNGGRWTMGHLENAAFKLALFFISGGVVYEFYALQAVWFGHGTAWSVLVPKILVDQFGYTVIFSVPYQTILTRWQTLGYSGARLWRELGDHFITQRILPVLVTNWMFWIPGVTLIYAMPSILQTPLFIFATTIWGLLLPAIGRPAPETKRHTGTLIDLVTPQPALAPRSAE